MRLTKVSGIEIESRSIEELAEAIEAEMNHMVLMLNRDNPKAVVISTTPTQINQGILVTLLYEIP
jgi:hypothetical protein